MKLYIMVVMGSGVFDSLLKPFTAEKYPGERHARSLDPKHFLQGYNYVGPGTQVDLRDRVGDNKPLNALDRAAEKHDRAYIREKKGYDRDKNKAKHIRNVWTADDEFVDEAEGQDDDPVMGFATAKMIRGKEMAEKAGLLPTTTFEGFGEGEQEDEEDDVDPTKRLKKKIKKLMKKPRKYLSRNSRRRRRMKTMEQEGGLSPLVIPVATALAPVAGDLLSDLYGFIKKKITGQGINLNSLKNKKDKTEFMIEVLRKL